MSHPTLLAPLLALLACHSPEAQEVRTAVARDATQPRSVAILVYEGVELLDFAGPGEVFAAARGSGGRAFRVFTVAASKSSIRSQGFVEVTPEFSFADCPAPDLVVVPGGNVPDDRAHVEWVQRCAAACELVMSVCNGAYLLADAGLLDGLEATTHHGSLEELAGAHPKTRVYTNRRFVDSGKILTCAGVSAGIDGALHVVERLLGDESARRTARYMEYEWRPAEIAALHAQPGRLVNEGPAYELAELAHRSGVEAALARYRLAEPRPDEAELNNAGYFLLRQGKKEASRALFELGVAAFPNSPNALDSLSEACEALDDAPAAIRHAEAALAELERAKGIDEWQASSVRNLARSRLVRLGKGDKSTLRFACAPCGGSCDALRFVAGGPCPVCHMEMVTLVAKE